MPLRERRPALALADDSREGLTERFRIVGDEGAQLANAGAASIVVMSSLITVARRAGWRRGDPAEWRAATG